MVRHKMHLSRGQATCKLNMTEEGDIYRRVLTGECAKLRLREEVRDSAGRCLNASNKAAIQRSQQALYFAYRLGP